MLTCLKTRTQDSMHKVLGLLVAGGDPAVADLAFAARDKSILLEYGRASLHTRASLTKSGHPVIQHLQPGVSRSVSRAHRMLLSDERRPCCDAQHPRVSTERCD